MSALPLDGLRVVDAASLFAGPVIGTMLGDYGADVIKIEQPAGDNLRSLGWSKDGVSLWWALIGRNKRSVTLKLSDPAGAEVARKLLAERGRASSRTSAPARWSAGGSGGTSCTRSTRTSSWSARPASGRPAPTPRARASGRSRSR